MRAKESTAQAVAVLAYCSPKTVASLLPVFPGLSLGPVTKVNGERVRELKMCLGWDSNPHFAGLEAAPSAKLGYRGICGTSCSLRSLEHAAEGCTMAILLVTVGLCA